MLDESRDENVNIHLLDFNRYLGLKCHIMRLSRLRVRRCCTDESSNIKENQ